MQISKLARFLILTFSLIFSTVALSENIITNGSFEDHGPFSHDKFGIFSEIPGWNAEAEPFEIQSGNASGIKAVDGNKKLELDAFNNSTIYTLLPTNIGQSYLLTLSYSPRVQKKGTDTNTIDIWWNNNKIGRLSGDKRGWKKYSFVVSATNETTKLSLKAKGKSDRYGGLIDDVQLKSLSRRDNELKNGSFEQHGKLDHVNWGAFKNIPHWKATQGLLEIQTHNVSGIGAVDGIAKAELDAYKNSTIEQKLTHLVKDEKYQLILNYSPRVPNHNNTNKVQVRWNNKKLATLNGVKKGWRKYVYTVVAKSTNYLQFKAIGRSDRLGGLIDDIQLYCISCETQNQPPVANAGSDQIVFEGEPVQFDGTGSNDPDGQIVKYEWKQGSSLLSEQVQYTKSDFSPGNHTITLTVTDDKGDRSTDTVIISVEELVIPNRPPVADSQTIQTEENQATSIQLVANDEDGDTLSYSIVSTPQSGSIEGIPPEITYTPNNGFFGTDSLTFKANDGTVDSTVATISITVSPVNDKPIAQSQSLQVNEDESLSITLTGSDLDGDSLSYAISGQPNSGTLNGTAPNLTYTPNANFHGTDSFSFKANDGVIDSELASVNITVNSINDLPTVNAVADQTITEGEAITLQAIADDSDGTLVNQEWKEGTQTLGNTLEVTLNDLSVGVHTFIITVTDNEGATASDSVTVTVEPKPNTAPIAEAQTISTDEDTETSITLSGTDNEGDTLDYEITTSPQNGVLSGIAPSLTYTPNANYHGTDSFLFKVNDGGLDSTPVMISITVNSVNDAPTVDAGADQTITEGESAILQAVADDSDGTIVSQEWKEGTQVLGNSLELTLDNLSAGDHNLVFTAWDNDGGVASDSVKITVLENQKVPGSLSGKIVDENGVLVANAKVKLSSGQVVLSDLRGNYKVEDVPPIERLTVTVSRFNFLASSEIVEIKSGKETVQDIVLSRPQKVEDFDANTGVTVEIDGMTVELPADGYVNTQGDKHEGEVSVLTSYIPAIVEGGNDGLPSDTLAVNENGEVGSLVPVGSVKLELIDGLGNDIGLSDGETIELSIPVGNISDLPDTILVWVLDDETGLLVEYGVATFERSSGILKTSISPPTPKFPVIPEELIFAEIPVSIGTYSDGVILYETTLEVCVEDGLGNQVASRLMLISLNQNFRQLSKINESGSFLIKNIIPEQNYKIYGIANDGRLGEYSNNPFYLEVGETRLDECIVVDASKQSEALVVSGKVTDDAGNVKENVDVKVFGEAGNGSSRLEELASLKSDENGDFNFLFSQESLTAFEVALLGSKNITVKVFGGSNYIIPEKEVSLETGKATYDLGIFELINNKPPIANAGLNQIIYLGEFAKLFTDGSFDPDGSIELYEWHLGDTLLKRGDSSLYQYAPSEIGNYTFVLTVTDDRDLRSSDEVVITVIEKEHQELIIDAGTDKNVYLGESVKLEPLGTLTSDIQYEWREAGSILGTSKRLNYIGTQVGEHVITLIARNENNQEKTDDVVVNVIDKERFLIVDAGLDKTIYDTGRFYYINPVITSDGIGTLRYKWTENGNDLQYGDRRSFPYKGSIGTHTLKLTVTNDKGDQSSDFINITIVEPKERLTTGFVDAGLDQTAYEGDFINSTADYAFFTSPVSFEWKEGGELLSTSRVLSYEANELGSHVITLTVTGGDGKIVSDDVVFTVISDDREEYIHADAGVEQTLYLDEEITLDGTRSFSNKGVLDFKWTEGDVELEQTVRGKAIYKATQLGTHTINMRVTGENGSTRTDQVIITVIEPRLNADIFADAGLDQSIYLGQSVDLTSEKSYSVTGDLSYEWTEGATLLGQSQDLRYLGAIAGRHIIKLTVTDNKGLVAADEVVVSVISDSPIDTTPPVITLNGDNNITIEHKSSYVDQGATAIDDRDGVITENIIVATLDTSIIGTFIITYTVEDNAGNEASITRTVNVVSSDVSPPVITVLGLNPENIPLNSVYADSGARATDDRDGTVEVVTAGTVDTAVPGSHRIIYTATDSAGNTATAVRTVIVIDSTSQVCPIVRVVDDSQFVDRYPDDNIEWVGNNYSDVLEIEKAFNNARLIDHSVFQYLKMPSQSEWDGMSAQEQGLYLINSERQARGIKPYEGVSQNVVDIAQEYTDFIRGNNQVIGHENDGRSPQERLDSDSDILANSDSGILPESVFASYSHNGSALPTATTAIVQAVYWWTYFDKFPLSGNAWGHRDQILQTELDENSGEPHKEGLIGFGVSIGDYDPYQTNPGGGGAVVTLNIFDPSSTWDQSTTQGVNIDAAQLCNNHVVIDVDGSIASVDQLISLEITSPDIFLTPSTGEQLQVIGTYENGSQLDVTNAVSFVADVRAIVSVDSGYVTALRHGSVYISARANGITSNSVLIRIDAKTDISNLGGTFAEDYQEFVPDNVTISNYDPKAFTLFSGVVKDRYGTPLSDVTLSVHNQPEYGSVKTDIEGRFVLAAEAGTRRLVYQKPGYLTIHREKNSASNGWAIVDDVVMMAVDTKQTQINLGSTEPQTHTSTVVSDQFGSRSTTLVFDGISSATVKTPDGSVRSLDSFSVRATEYEVPQSMPAELPVESAFTYCSELQIPGVRDDETVTFDKPVVMYVDNFLNFNVGEIVPIGYYDRNEGKWKGSDNGIVVKLLDADNDGKIDGVDYSGDDIADDINGNGITTDETVGIENYPAGQTYWRGSFNHFTPWDFNWPYIPPTDAIPPQEVKPESSNEDKDDKECAATNSYVKPYQQAFHEDIPVTGTNLTLHYSSQRTEGYKHKIKVQVSGDSVPASMTNMIVRLDIGGKLFERTFAPQANKNTEFIWDGKDPSGKRVEGVVRGRLSIGYKYQAEYSSAGRITTYEELANFEQAWAQLGSNTTGITGRDDFISWNSRFIDIQNTYETQIADGWTLSNHHESSPLGSIYKGNGDVIDGDKASLVLKTGIQTSQHTGDDGYYQKGGSSIDYSINSAGALEDKVTGLEWQYSFPRRKFRNKILASDYCSVISRETGQAGWRLPTSKEVIYTIDKSAGNHDFPIYQFKALNYWTENTSNLDGRLIPLICVKGEELNTSYIVDLRRNDTDEVVVDGQNGLMWQDDISTTSNTFGWAGSIEYCENLDHAGYTDWRLPNINELTYALPNTTFVNQTILDYPNGELWTSNVSWRKPYWSSTPNFNNSGQAWAMESESWSFYGFSKSDQNYVRCVRDNIQSARTPYRFDDKRRHVKTIDLNSGTTLTTFNYDDQDRLVSMIDRFGDTVTLNRDINTGKVASITSHDGYVTNLTIDENNDLTQVDYGDGSNYQFIYDL